MDWKKTQINILLEAECEINKILQIGGEINNLSSSKTTDPPLPPPLVIERNGKYVLLYPATPHVKPMLAQCWSTVY